MELHLGGQIDRLARGRSSGGRGIGINEAIEIMGQSAYFACFVLSNYLTVLKIFLTSKRRIATRIFPAFLTIISC
jgi:hypothetical protein